MPETLYLSSQFLLSDERFIVFYNPIKIPSWAWTPYHVIRIERCPLQYSWR